MGAQARSIPGKIIKIIILCAVVWLVLYGAQLAIDFLTYQTDQATTKWELQKVWYVKYPLFLIVAYLVFSESI